jgi:hypothetical protein
MSITPAPLWAQRGPTPVESAADFTPDFNLLGHQAHDPLMRKFATGKWQTPQWGPFDAKDPILDQDPFFMRSQSYGAAFSHPNGEGTAFRHDSGGLEIHLPGTKQSLKIRQPLAPLFEIQNFLVMQATDPALFSSKVSNPEYRGEGLFFIDKRYIYTELRKSSGHRPVPVFFLPLEGTGWTGKIQHVAVGPVTTFAFRTENGEQSTLDLTQITQLSQLLHNHVVITTLIAMKNDIALVRQIRAQYLAQGNLQELPFVYPPRGSTAAFGTMVAGVDLDNPGKGLFPLKGAGSSWNLDILPKAHALDLLTPDILSRLLIVASVTGTAFVTGWVAQYTILRKRMLERRAYIESKEDQVASQEGKPVRDRSGAWYKVKREFKETIDVFSHGLASLSSGFGVGLGFMLEYGADRLLGRQGSNGMVRWFLEKTFLYGRKANELIGANWSTFFLGVVILGGIDTISVGLQLLFVSPIFFPWVGHLISPEKEEQARHEFSGKDAETNNNVTSELMRNLTGYFVSGAYSYSSSQRMVLLEIVRPEVERQMSIEGKDIFDPKFKKEFEARIETRLELMLVERGLPTNAEFLFSGPSLTRGIAHLMGYKVNRRRLYESKDFKRADGSTIADEKELELFKDKKALERKVSQRVDALMEAAKQYPENKVETERFLKAAQSYKDSLVVQLEKAYDNESFVLENARWGLIRHSLKRAQGAAMELLAQDPNNAHLKAAVDILKETRNKYQVFWRIAKNPLRTVNAIKEYREIAEMLSILSREDDVVGTGVKYLDLWDAAKTQPEGALIAGRMFRQAFFGRIQDHPEFLKPTAESAGKYLPSAREKAAELIAAAPGELGYDEFDKEVVALEIVKTQVLADQKKVTAQGWQPPKQDMLEQAQRENAHREALTKVLEATGGQVEPSPLVEQALAAGNIEAVKGSMERVVSDAEQELLQNPQVFNIYREAYRQALADQVGLVVRSPEQSELVKKTMDLADKEVQVNQEKNPGWAEYMKHLDEIGKARFLTHQYADSFLSKYAELTVSNSSSVSLTSPEQPGFFQKARQLPIANKDTWYGRTIRTVLRALESPMDQTAYRPGLNNWARRNIPWYQDGKTTVVTNFRLMWTAMTIGYLVQYNIWQVKFGWPVYLFFFWVSGLTSIVHYWTDRLMMNMGVRPMQTTWGKVKYSLLYTWLTYPTYLPFFFFVKDFQTFWKAYVTSPLQSYLVSPVVSACEKLLSAIF